MLFEKSSSPTKIAEYLLAGLPIISNAGVGDLDSLIRTERVGTILSDFPTRRTRRLWKKSTSCGATLVSGQGAWTRYGGILILRRSAARGIEEFTERCLAAVEMDLKELWNRKYAAGLVRHDPDMLVVRPASANSHAAWGTVYYRRPARSINPRSAADGGRRSIPS